MDNKFEKDLTTGNVWHQLVLFSLPFLASNMVQSCFNLVDMIILGNFGGTNSLSGVSISGGIMTILTTLAGGIATGGTVVIGNYIGANLKERINKVISTLLIALGCISIVISSILLLFSSHMLSLLKAPSESFGEAKSYLIICAIGMIFIFGYSALASIMRGLGDAKTPMKFIIIACIINIILDLILVAYLGLGARGAALATVLAQAFSMICCIVYLKSHDFMFDFRPSSFKFSRREFISIIKTGLPMSIQSVATNFSFLLLNSFNSRLGGVDATAASAVVMNFNGFALLPSIAVNQAATTMISQNTGKGLIKRSSEVITRCLIMVTVICAVVFTLVHLIPNSIFNAFGAEESVIICGIPYLLAFSFEYVGVPFIIAANAFLTGTGRGWVILIITLCASFLFRIPVAYLLGFTLKMGIVGVAYSIPIATLAGAIFSWGCYLTFKNKPLGKIN